MQLLLKEADSLKEYDLNSALQKSEEAEKIVKGHRLDSLLPKVYMTQGKLFIHNAEYPKALQKLLAAETDYEQLLEKNEESVSLKRGMASCLQKISEVHFELNRLDKALEYIDACLILYKELDDSSQIAKATSNLGAIYFKMELYEEALDTYFEVLEYYTSSGERQGLQTLYSNIGSANLILKNLDVSIEYLNLAEAEILLALASDKDNNVLIKELSQVYYVKSIYYYMLEDQDSYGEYLHKSLEVLGDNYAPIDANAPLFTLHKFYNKKGDYKKAYDYLLMHQAVKDSLFNIKNTSRIHQLEKEQALFKKQRAYELEKGKTERLYWISLAGLLMVILIILLFLNQQKKKIITATEEKKRLNKIKSSLENVINAKEEILIKKEREVKRLASKIVAKNKNINTLQDHVDQIDRSLRNDINHKKIKDMIKSSGDTEAIEKDRKQLLLNLEQISIGMFEKMDADFEGITKRQKLLAALVKQGFSAKEIAILFNITHKAAQTGKYRLKKSLKLGIDQDLDSFLKNY